MVNAERVLTERRTGTCLQTGFAMLSCSLLCARRQRFLATTTERAAGTEAEAADPRVVSLESEGEERVGLETVAGFK